MLKTQNLEKGKREAAVSFLSLYLCYMFYIPSCAKGGFELAVGKGLDGVVNVSSSSCHIYLTRLSGGN
jgi:hypothetical protein